MGILGAIVVGFVVGLLARLVMPGRDPGGFFITTLLGIAGALIARYIGQAMGFYGPEDSAGFLAALVGALLLLGVYRLVARPRVAVR